MRRDSWIKERGGIVATALVGIAGIGLAGCMTTTLPPRRATTTTCKVPVITAQPETRESQEKGGIEIAVAPVTYTVSVKRQERTQQAAPPMLSVSRRGEIYTETISTSTATVEPDRLRFLVTIHNKLPRVFHGAGTVVQFNVGGRLQAVDHSGYNALLGTIIPPKQEQQIEIVGPPLSSLTPDKGILGVFLYDVVTDQNVAGVVTEKQNYEWYFDYTLETRESAAETTVTQAWMTPRQYSEVVTRQHEEMNRTPQTTPRR